jgi:hypothetical protein
LDRFAFLLRGIEQGGFAMRNRTSPTLLLVALAITGVWSLTATAQKNGSRRCSAESVAGRWAFTTTGSIPLIGPVAATGVYTADASGNIKGRQTRSLNGDVADETFTATGNVNPNCTANYLFRVYESGVLVRTSTLHIVYDDNNREGRAVFVSIVLPDGTVLPSILTVETRRQFPKD